MSKNSADRFYLMEFKNRPAFWGDVGSNLRLEGIIIAGEDQIGIVVLPGSEPLEDRKVSYIYPSTEEICEFIRFSDDPEILTDPVRKIFQRKLRFAISGDIQQKVWAADNFRCMYCDAQMGKTLLTIAHFIPLELGGVNDTSNYLTACKKCNKRKGNIHPKEYFESLKEPRTTTYDSLCLYLKNRKL
jgi:hypothetical protein